MFFAAINLYLYQGDGWVPITYYESEHYVEYGEVFALIWYWFQKLLGPNKLNWVLSIAYIIGFGYLNYWTQMMYYLVPLLPKFAMEFIVFVMYPTLDIPDMPYEAVV
jgi:hypothetical protein